MGLIKYLTGISENPAAVLLRKASWNTRKRETEICCFAKAFDIIQ